MSSLKSVKALGETDARGDEQADRFAGPWFDTKTAAAYIPCRTVRAFYEWRRRHGVIARANGSVAKADLNRILRRRKVRRVMASASLANLRKRQAS